MRNVKIFRATTPGVTIVLAAILVCAQAGCGRKQDPRGAKPAWHNSLDEALQQASKDRSLVLVNVSGDRCPWCRKLEDETLADATVRERLGDFALLKVNVSEQRDLAMRLGAARGVPLSVVLDAEGNPIAQAPGYMPPETYLKFLAWADEQAKKRAS